MIIMNKDRSIGSLSLIELIEGLRPVIRQEVQEVIEERLEPRFERIEHDINFLKDSLAQNWSFIDKEYLVMTH